MANFYLRFVDSVERTPDVVAVEMQRQSGAPDRYTYAQTRRSAEAVGRWLQSRALPAGSRCALLARNGPRWLDAYLGTIASGHVAVPLDTNFKAEQVAKLLKDSGAALLFADAKHLPAARQAVEGLAAEIFLLDEPTPAGPGAFACAPAEDGDTAVIVYTSGTTSDPKGVMLTHGGLKGEMEAVFTLCPIDTSDAVLGVLPLFHVLAQMANLLLPLAAGSRVVFLEAAVSAELVRALRERQITVFVCVPQFFYLIHEKIMAEVAARGRAARTVFRLALDLSGFLRRAGLNPGRLLFSSVHRLLGPKLRYLVTGGARIDAAICRDFTCLGFNLLQAYGLSETTGAVCATPPGRVVGGSVGLPMRGVTIRLVDPKPDEEAGGRAVGEIAVSSPTLMKGYYNRPEATAEVLKDGWLFTGDLGYRDEGGNLFISGRKKEMIVLSNGKNIFPEELEAHYLRSPFIKEICVIGLRSLPGEPFSERLHGVVVPNFEVLRRRKIVNAQEVVRFDLESLSAHLPPAKRILSYDLWQDDLPRTTTRKIKRFAVERLVKERRAAAAKSGEAAPVRELSPEERDWLARPDVASALEIVRGSLKNHAGPVQPRDNIELDLGLDSLERVELLAKLERELGAQVQDWSQAQVFTVRELVDAVLAGVGKSGGRGAARTWDAIFGEETTDPEALEITKPRPVTDRLWWLFFLLVRLWAKAFYRLEVSGLEQLPQKGAFILCPNHQSYLDAPVLIAALPFSAARRLFYVGTSEIFGAGLARRVARTLRLIPIDPDVNMVSAMKAGAYGLAQGRALVLFPEGERSIDGTPKTFKKGAAILSAHRRVPIVPVAISGFYDAWPRGGSLRPRGRLRIAIGEPLLPPARVESEAVYGEMTTALKERVLALWTPLRA